MNERINDLMNEAMPTIDWKARNGVELNNGERLEYMTQWFEKFAELIVRECAVYCEGHILPKGMAEENDLNYNDGVMDCVIGLKQHFGVEE
jgi:hypothetical protein